MKLVLTGLDDRLDPLLPEEQAIDFIIREKECLLAAECLCHESIVLPRYLLQVKVILCLLAINILVASTHLNEATFRYPGHARSSSLLSLFSPSAPRVLALRGLPAPL